MPPTPTQKFFIPFPVRSNPSQEQLVSLGRRLGMGGELHLDLEGVAHLSSAALGTLLSVNRRLAVTGKRLVLTNLDPALDRLLHLTGLAAVLEGRCRQTEEKLAAG